MSEEQAREYFDQVVRLQAFQAAHSHVTIEHQTAPLWRWLATWTDAGGAGQHKVDHELKGLLDQLERVFPPAP